MRLTKCVICDPEGSFLLRNLRRSSPWVLSSVTAVEPRSSLGGPAHRSPDRRPTSCDSPARDTPWAAVWTEVLVLVLCHWCRHLVQIVMLEREQCDHRWRPPCVLEALSASIHFFSDRAQSILKFATAVDKELWFGLFGSFWLGSVITGEVVSVLSSTAK